MRPPVRTSTRRWADVSPPTFTWPELIALELMKPVEQRVKVPGFEQQRTMKAPGPEETPA